MVHVLVFGAAAGAILGLRSFAVFALLPVFLVVAVSAIAIGVTAGHDSLAIILAVLAAVASPQIGYFMSNVVSAYLHPPALPCAVQMTIGEDLRAVYQPAWDPPAQIVELLERMK
jgi:hypothetical protein